MRSIITYAVEHRVTMLMVTLAAVIFGVVSLGRLPVQLLPNISYPTLTLQTEYPDSAPNEIENLISRPLEEAVGVVPGLRRIVSSSRAGVSEITLEFGWDTDMNFAALDVREKVDLIQLPQDAKAPVLLRYDPALDPVVRLGLSGGTNPIMQRYLGEQVIKKELESLKGVAASKVLGGLTEEIHIDVDEQRLAALQIPISSIANALGSENINAAGGRLRDRDTQFLVRTLNEFQSPEDIAETVVFSDDVRIVKLGEVARITRAYKEREVITRIDGEPAVEIAIYKEGDANLVDVAARVRGHLRNLDKVLPAGVNVEVLSDQSTFIESAVKQVQNNALMGGVLAILVLLVFLRDFRSTFIIALAIPTSIITTFVLMYKQGLTLNVMSLGGLALGVGMLVDNSIVVLESIVRHVKQGGKDRAESVIEGTNEVAQAVAASTFTTVAVFLPILFVEGIARQIFKDQALTVTYALLVSLVVSLTLTPMVASLGRKKKSNEKLHAPEKTRPHGFFNRVYGGLLHGALNNRALVVLTAVALFAGSLYMGRSLGADLIPPLSQGEFKFSVEFPEGTPIEQTNVNMAQIEESLLSIPYVASVYANIGIDADESGSIRSKKENHAELNVTLHPSARGEKEEQIINQVREKIGVLDNASATLKRPTYFTFKTPIAVEIYGYDLRTLSEVSDRVAGSMDNIEGLRDVTESLEAGSPEIQVRFDREKLKKADIDLATASQTLRTSILGRVATDYKEQDRQLDVLVRSDDSQSLAFADLPSMIIGYKNGVPVRLASVAEVVTERGPAEILRVSQTRAAVVSANLQNRDLGSVTSDIQTVMAGIPLPPNISVAIGGQNEEMQSSLKSLKFAVALAIFMVYLVMASQFESLLNPFLILFTVPMALIGVVAALVVTQTPVSVVVMIGAIMLAGIVVNNGIVLVDLVSQLQRRGYSVRDALVEAGQTRLRPILMTTTTTVLALIPMALGRGEGGEIGAPLAVTVIGGLLVATLLTLVVIPVLYSLTHRDKPSTVEA